MEQPASSDPNASIQDYVPAPSVPDDAFAHLSNPVTTLGYTGATLASAGLVGGTQWSFSRFGSIKSLTISEWIRAGDIMLAQGATPGQKYLVLILPSNSEYNFIQPYFNALARIPEFRTTNGAGTIFPDRVVMIPLKTTP